jgi:uncharacterized pyridoxal phosphate-dependent enzyme
VVIYDRLGVRPVINASATLTRLGGSLMPPPVIDAMNQAATAFVDLSELHEAAGQRIADLTGNEAAYVSSGAAAGITLTVATCIAGADPANRYVFPELNGLTRTEVLCHPDQASPYRYAANLTGARIVEVGGGLSEFTAAINERTACILWFAGSHLAGGSPPLPDVIAAAHEADVPVIVDAAAQIPPSSSLWHFTRELDADAAIFSGGKGLRGPQASGLVLGRREIIDGCRVHGNPNHAIGRPMKSGKEEIAGLVAAVEWSLEQDEPAALARYEHIVQGWIEGLKGIPGVRVERGYPSEAGQPHGRAIVTIEGEGGVSRDELVRALWEQSPRIAVAEYGDHAIALNPQTLVPGEEHLVLDAIRAVLTGIRA